MKVKVLKKFKDKRTGKIYKPDTFIEVTKERLEEINETDNTLVKAVETAEPENEKTAEETPEKKKKAKKNKSE